MTPGKLETARQLRNEGKTLKETAERRFVATSKPFSHHFDQFSFRQPVLTKSRRAFFDFLGGLPTAGQKRSLLTIPTGAARCLTF